MVDVMKGADQHHIVVGCWGTRVNDPLIARSESALFKTLDRQELQ
jgi:hypothetical protein